ncbi:MAG: 50S ribosomal protein L11 methyltransferase [Myxococcota bacterium]
MTVELALAGLPRIHLATASERLFAAGATGLQEDWLPGEAPAPRQPWDVGPAPPEPDRLVLRAWFDDPDRVAIERAVRTFGATATWVDVVDTDWDAVWRAQFHPSEVGPGLIVAPPWDAPPGALVIEPGQGFGTGAHPTTLQALRALLALAGGHRTALDVGCGSGILALAAARLGLDAVGIDVEPAAIRDADRNAAANGLIAAFSTTRIDEVVPLDRSGLVPGRFDLVLANLHAELVIALADQLDRVTGQTLILAGILADREAQVRAALDPRSLTLVHRDQDGEWVALGYRRST